MISKYCVQFLLLSSFLAANPYSDAVYDSIRDITQPTIEDYKKIQKYKRTGKLPFKERLDQWQYKKKTSHINLIGRNSKEKIEFGLIPVNTSSDDRENCIILYASFNYKYPNCLKELIKKIVRSDFKGHIFYRLGGWPNLENGDLKMAHIPYAFKACMFKEAESLGFKRVLWLDAPMTPLISLQRLFKEITNKGYFTYNSPHTFEEVGLASACKAIGFDLENVKNLYGITVGIIGYDLSNPISKAALDTWYDITKHNEEASFSARPEYHILGLVHQFYGLTDNDLQDEKLTHARDLIRYKVTEFYYNKKMAQPKWPSEEE